jgi:hypothetical protein
MIKLILLTVNKGLASAFANGYHAHVGGATRVTRVQK